MTADEPGGALRTITSALDAVDIVYMVVGSFASSAHGEPRTTRDLDIVIDPDPDQLERFLSMLDLERFYADADVARDALQRRSMFNIIEMETGWKLDLVIRKARAFSIEELRRRQRIEIASIDVNVASPEDTIIAKLEWAKQSGGSERQLRDVVGIMRVAAERLDVAYIDRWIHELGIEEQWQRACELAG